jgi:hypothetical protein
VILKINLIKGVSVQMDDIIDDDYDDYLYWGEDIDYGW